MTSVFVGGATGYTGREVVRLAVAGGLRTFAHVRPDSAERERWQTTFEGLGAAVDTTPWEAGAFEARFAELAPDVVFALLGTTRKRGGDYEKVDYGMTATLFDAASAMPKKPRFVYLSAGGVSAREPSATSYMHARWKCEKMLREGAVPYTVLRAPIITGRDRDEDRLGERVGAALANGALAFAGALGARKLHERYRSTTNTAVAEALLRLSQDPSAENAVLEGEALR